MGTCRETVTQILNDLKADGLIRIARKQVVLLNMPRLRTLADS
jgi:CRP-like cAMP-binding protein